jgi:hypothetical protein
MILRDPIRESLRQGVRSKILSGWYSHMASDGSARWIICIPDPADKNSSRTESRIYNDEEIEQFCDMLNQILD